MRMIPFRSGSLLLIRRALAMYAKAERDAVSAAVLKGPPAHAEDVRRQVAPRLEAVRELLERELSPGYGRETSNEIMAVKARLRSRSTGEWESPVHSVPALATVRDIADRFRTLYQAEEVRGFTFLTEEPERYPPLD
jgi:hypothetical protein